MKTETLLCISSFFTFWGDRMWQFATGIFLIKLTPGSLRLGATYGLVLSASAIIFSPMVGGWIDRNQRLKVVQILLVIQNSLVVVCAIVIYLCLQYNTNDDVQLLLQSLIIILGSAANLASQGQKIAVSKDWLVVVCKRDKDLLAHINAVFRRIDLTVAILGPLAVGALMSGVSLLAGIIMICVWNILSLFFEYSFLYKAYKQKPELAEKKNLESSQDGEDGTSKPTNWNLFLRLKSTLSGWKVFYNQRVFLAGCALSLLYLTVIGFSTITTGFVVQEGMSEFYLSICMGLGSLFGVFGTFLFPKIRECIGLIKTGIIGFTVQLSMLSLCGLSIWLPGSPSSMFSGSVYAIKHNTSVLLPNTFGNLSTNLTTTTSPNIPENQQGEKILTSVIVLMAGIILSRTGLWITDLVITQLQQEYVAESERGIVGGVQYAANMLFDVCQYVLTIVLPHPAQFGFLVLISICAIFLGMLIYILFVTRFHLMSPKRGERENYQIL